MSTNARTRRAVGIAAGIGTHLLFAYTIWHLFWFLKGRPNQISNDWVAIDSLLALQFAVPHSILLLPSTRRRIGNAIGSAFYGLFFCVATCVSLLLMFAFWRTSTAPVWMLDGMGKTAIEFSFIGAWVALLYSINLTGLGYQTGLTPWINWLRGRKQLRREFHPSGAYLWIRHPVYLSFMGLIWLNPGMSLDRLLLAGIWSVYIFVGSYLKDERLAFYLGQSYRDYQMRVVGFPLMFFGPLAKRPSMECAKSNADSPVDARIAPPADKPSKMAA